MAVVPGTVLFVWFPLLLVFDNFNSDYDFPLNVFRLTENISLSRSELLIVCFFRFVT